MGGGGDKESMVECMDLSMIFTPMIATVCVNPIYLEEVIGRFATEPLYFSCFVNDHLAIELSYTSVKQNSAFLSRF